MTEYQAAIRVPRWPFYIGDALLLALAGWICWNSDGALSVGGAFACVFSVAAGAWLAVWPWVMEYRAALKLAETAALSSAVEQIGHLDKLAAQITSATAHWQTVQEQSAETVRKANEITGRIAAEAKGFSDFLRQANDGEKATLRVEVDKLRRAETEWVQVAVGMLDHVYALHQAAARSNQRGLIQQLGQFQHACRDIARHVGLVPFEAAPDESFDEKRHRLADGTDTASPGAQVAETIATGYTFQGRIVRSALVTLKGAQPQENVEVHAASSSTDNAKPGRESTSPAIEQDLL